MGSIWPATIMSPIRVETPGFDETEKVRFADADPLDADVSVRKDASLEAVQAQPLAVIARVPFPPEEPNEDVVLATLMLQGTPA
jgi:hypothetical protein